MQTVTYTKTGTKAKTKVNLDSAVFGAKVNETLLAQAVRIYRDNQRQANAHTKDRGEVRGGGRKPWRQKGTGRARHGSTRSPIWTRGGVTFGPTNSRSYKKQLSKKMRKQAVRSAFSMMASGKKLSIFEDIAIAETARSKALATLLRKAKLEGKTLIVQAENNQSLVQAASNVSNVEVSRVGELNVFSILNAGNLVILKGALETISNFWGSEKPVKSTKLTPKTKAKPKAKKK
ncbi:MAG: 50S ribosomal protein L4 [Candidatus Dojkabacteria bacterium]